MTINMSLLNTEENDMLPSERGEHVLGLYENKALMKEFELTTEEVNEKWKTNNMFLAGQFERSLHQNDQTATFWE